VEDFRMNSSEDRWFGFAVCIAGAALLLLFGWLMPVYLHAVDLAVLQQAANSSAPRPNSNPPVAASPRIKNLIDTAVGDAPDHSDTVDAAVIRLENRDRILDFLQSEGSPAVRQLLRCRGLTNTVLFPPSASSSGQAFDAAVSVCGLLLEENALAPGLREVLLDRAGGALGGGSSEPLEEVLMDMMSLGQRFNWNQLTVFVQHIGDARTLDLLAVEARSVGPKLPALHTAVEVSQNPAAVANYLGSFSKTGLGDVETSLRLGAGALDELLRRNQRIHTSDLRERVQSSALVGIFSRAAADWALRGPWIALTVKWIFYLSGGFLIALGLHFAREVPEMEEALQVRGFHVFREMLFALGFLLVVLLLSEPFLAQDSQKVETHLRLRLPGIGSAAAVKTPTVKPKIMNPVSLLTLLLFFVLQGLIYSACVVKLAEIRRQNVPPRVRLKLLENEEHLFDAGLYLGFCGTVVSLIMASMGVVQFSLMAAYSSTSFGIIFVSVFKIFQLRPVRRQLLLQSETESGAAPPPAVAPISYATTP
jgi:hypothetical protein